MTTGMLVGTSLCNYIPFVWWQGLGQGLSKEHSQFIGNEAQYAGSECLNTYSYV